MDNLLQKIKDAVIAGKANDIEGIVREAVNAKADLNAVINDAMIAAMDVVGQRYSKNEIYVPEMLVSAVTMKRGLDILTPLLGDKKQKSAGKIVMGTVKGDIHDIGKNLVIMMLQGAGFDVIDLGVDLTPEKIVEEVKKHIPDILGLSALLTTTMPEVQIVIDALKEAGIRDNLKIMVGGAPVNEEWAIKVGADGYGADAGHAVEVARSLIK